MAKGKNKLNKTKSSGWLDNYSEDLFINRYPNGGSIWDEIKKEFKTDVVDPLKRLFTVNNKPTYTNIKSLPKSFNIQDKRTINPITKKPLNPNTDLKNFKNVSKSDVEAIVKMADYLNYPRDLALAVSLQESGLGKIDPNLGHNLDYDFVPKMEGEVFSDAEQDAGAFITGLIDKAEYAKNLYNQKKIPKNDLIYQLQAYNGFGTLNPNTELNYYETPNQKFYGVDVKGKPLSMKQNPLYGKTIINFRDSIVKQDPTLKKFLNLPKYYVEGGEVEIPIMKNGGQHGGLDRWFAEKWVDVKTGKECGRQKGEKRKGYPACRPSKRITSETPKTASELSSAEKAKFKREKTSSERIDYNHKKEDGGLIYTDMKKNIEKYPEGGIIKKTLPEVVVSAKRPSKDENDWMDYMAMAGMGAQLAGAGASSTGVGVLAGGPLALAGYAMGVPDAVRDTYNSYNEGNYGDAALSATGLIPGFNLMKDLGMFTKGARFVNKAENFNKAINALNVFDRLKEEAEKNKPNQKILGTSKYPAGGYLDYQEGYKGFGVGPQLYQDNSYFRSVMPDNIENMEEQINQPSVFSGINNVLGSVNQGVNRITGLMSNLGGISANVKGSGEDSYLSQMESVMAPFKKTYKSATPDTYNVPVTSSAVNSQTGQALTTDKDIMSGIGLGQVLGSQNGGYIKQYPNGGDIGMLPVGYPEYIHKSNVFNEHIIPVPKVHFSDDTSVFDMGVNLNDLIQMYGGTVNKYQNGGDMSLQGYFNYLTNQNQNAVPKNAFNSNTQRATAEQLQSATANDFLNTKMRNDRQSFKDDQVDWGFMNWAKDPVAGYLGVMSTIPIVGDVTKDIVGDSFLTRREGYQVGKGIGKTTFGAGKIAGGIATGNVGMIGSGIGDVGEGVGSTYGNLAARDSLAGYDKSGYVSNKKLERASQDFGNMMNTASSLYGNVSGGVNQLKGLGGMKGIMGNLKGGETGMKGFGNVMGKISGFAQDGGIIDYMFDDIEEYAKGGIVIPKKVSTKNKKNTNGWLDTL
jgi:hypothetical protein